MEPIKMKKTMNRICALSLSLAMLSACAQTQVSVKPSVNSAVSKAPNKPAAAPAKPASSKPAIKNQDAYVVEAGDTLYGIATRAGLSYLDVASWNNIGEPFTLKAGQRINLRPPEGSLPTPFETVPEKPVVASDVKPDATKPTVAKLPAPSTVPSKPPVVVVKPVDSAVKPASDAKPVDVKPADTKPVNKPLDTKPIVTKPVDTKPTDTKPAADANSPAWQWPTQGNLIARFVQGDPSQQGINIAGKSGQEIYAAADGTVVYSGAGLVGYGELIIIKHSSQWLSAYAHSRKRLVAEGAKVKAGDQIAEMGRTGVIRDMLHFEIRKNGKPVDPLQYLPSK
jgi:lipoprotein NlpD